MPKEAVLFVGDFIMPFIGAPFFEEGNVPGLLEAMDVLVSLNPKYVLHGHETLTRLYDRDKEPQPGFLREVYYQLANLYQQDNNEQEASNYLALSGYDGFDKTIMLITFFGS